MVVGTLARLVGLVCCVVCLAFIGVDGISYKTDVALYSAEGKLLWESSTYKQWGTKANEFGLIGEAYSLCPTSPTNCDGVHNYIGKSGIWNAGGGNNLFNYLETHQYIIPYEFAGQVAHVNFTVKTPANASSKYRVLYHDEWISDNGSDWASQSWGDGNPAPRLSYPPKHGNAGDPIHLSVVDVQPSDAIDGNRVLGIWLGFRSPSPCSVSVGSHCCHLTDKTDDLWNNGFHNNDTSCNIDRPHYQCLQPSGSPWSSGQQVGFINFVGSLNGMADGKPINIHFDDGVKSSIPFTNSYAETAVRPSQACSTVCELLYHDQPWDEAKWQNSSATCQIEQIKKVAKAGLGPVTISGFGLLSGFKLMDSGDEYFGQQVWKDFDGTNGGHAFSGGVFKDHYKSMEWDVMSGLVELTTSDTSTEFAVDISNIVVSWAPKRGDGAVLVNAPYIELDDGGNSNTPARLWDIKTPGGWMDAADGPNVLSDNSVMRYAYLHHADDLVKISASGIQYSQITALQGNVGSVIELGNYGLGLRTGNVTNSVVEGVSVHRIVHADGGYDGDGGIFGTRTCPYDIRFKNITVNNVTIPQLGSANTVDQLFAIGALDSNAAFCGGAHGYASFEDLSFHNWRIYVNPSMYSKIYGSGADSTKVSNVEFYDRSQTSQDAILASAVQIYDSAGHYYCVCAMTTGAEKCWDMDGPSTKSMGNFMFTHVSATDLWFPYGPASQTEFLV